MWILFVCLAILLTVYKHIATFAFSSLSYGKMGGIFSNTVKRYTLASYAAINKLL